MKVFLTYIIESQEITYMSDSELAKRLSSGSASRLESTEQEQYAQDLQRAIDQERKSRARLDRLRSTFLSTVNHEMRTPLVLILQSIELLDSNRLGTMTPDQLDTLMVLKRQAEKLDRMVMSLIRVAGFLSKQESIKPVMGRLTPVINGVLPLAEFKARSRQIAIITEIAPNMPPFPLDVKQIEEAVAQLLDNAIKFNRPNGKIKLSASAGDEWIEITVVDTGTGINPDRLETIWEVFEQNSDPVRRAQEGLGLGLVLVKYIIDAHQGVIEIDTKVGQGSKFTIKLPRYRP
ncbi:MAG: Sensor protein SrrB [Anaerolineae bacterium]|nr:Sensor protein SrrB [Anaerolineae bacterium]